MQHNAHLTPDVTHKHFNFKSGVNILVKRIAVLTVLLSSCFSGYSISAAGDATLIRDARGIAACPQGKFCLYTNANYNQDELGDVLAINPNVQLTSLELNNFGFPVGLHDGVSAVVNNLGAEGTLIRGSDISGTYRAVPAGAQISSFEDSWNDATNSVVTKHVTSVALPITLPNTTIHINESGQYAALSIQNLSNENVTVDVNVTGTPALFTILDYAQSMTIPANQIVHNNIALQGNKVGYGQLNVAIKPAVGYVNQYANSKTATIVVDEIVVPDFNITQSFKQKWQSWWPEEGWLYTYALQLQSRVDTIKYWKFSFDLPQGAHVTQAWLDSQSSWLKLNKEESVNGKVVLENIAGNVIAPNNSIPLDIEIFYLDESLEHEQLANLTIEKVQ